MKSLTRKILILPVIVIASAGICAAQDAANTAIKQIAEGRSFKFKAQTATLNNNEEALNTGLMDNGADISHKHIPLKGDCNVTVKPDSVASVLPYFDDSQAQDEPVNTAGDVTVTLNEKATHFAAKQYDYDVKEKKKGEVEVILKPKDNQDVERFTFDLKPDGTARLIVNVNGIKRITYDGSIVSK